MFVNLRLGIEPRPRVVQIDVAQPIETGVISRSQCLESVNRFGLCGRGGSAA
jgi:hypothetical protein